MLHENEHKLKELPLLERVIKVEEELKALREIESARFETMEKRFESLQREMNARFEAVEKRFYFMQWFMGIGFTVITVLMTLFNFLK